MISSSERYILFFLIPTCALCNLQAADPLVNNFDFDGTETFVGGIGQGNFQTSFGGLTPTVGSQFFASGNGNEGITFFDRELTKSLGGTIQDTPYEVQLNIAWYNSGQVGGMRLSDFDELFIGSGNGSMDWLSTPEPLVEDQWVTWTGIFTPASADVGQPWTFKMVYDLPPKRDIAIDLPATGYAQAVPEPSGFLVLAIGLTLYVAIGRRN